MSPSCLTRLVVLSAFASIGIAPLQAQSADWTEVIWREPQVRYLLADMTLNGGKTELYRKYASEERDPDSREAVRMWDLGARVLNTNQFQRKWIANKYGKDGRVMRVVLRGTDRTITGQEVLLTTDADFNDAAIRISLAGMTLGWPPSTPDEARRNVNISEALRRWAAGARAENIHEMETTGTGSDRRLVFRGSGKPFDPALIRLNSDVPYPETNMRYFMADIALGGSIEFYRAAAGRDHEMGCQEAVQRTEEGYRITNLDAFERKKVDGKTVITRKGSDERISGMSVKLSSDLP